MRRSDNQLNLAWVNTVPTQVSLWQIENGRPVSLAPKKLDLEERIENWLRDDIGLIANDILVIGQQVETDYGGKIDLLAVDGDGNLVILELKRDKTPRDIVAQILDYASWVKDLTHEKINDISARFLKNGSLDDAFQKKFGANLPDVLNERHRMYVVASALDSATERIVRYLSETHGVDINVATFAYFKNGDSEFIGRSFMLDEADVERRVIQSKRAPARTLEELRNLAVNTGVVEIYDKALLELRPLFRGMNRTRSNVAFVGYMGENEARNVIVAIYPGLSKTPDGLCVVLNSDRLYEYFCLEPDQFDHFLGPVMNDVLPGYNARLFDQERLSKLISILQDAKRRTENIREGI